MKTQRDETAFAAYEATKIGGNGSRAWVYMPTVDARRELTSYDRTELIRRAHWMYNNLGIAARAIDGVARYACPLVPQARSSNPAWNKKVEQLFEDACGTAAFGFDMGAEVNFYEAQPYILRQIALDGDFFWQKVLSKNGRGMVRFIGGESVGNSSNMPQGQDWVDGVLPDRFGRPQAYNVLQPGDSSKGKIVSADELHQVKRMYRRGYLRAPSWLARASNHLQDISEILGFEKASFKMNAQVAFVITSPDAGNIGLGASRNKQPTGAGPVTVDSLYNSSGVPQLQPGEKIESFTNTHPNTNFKAFLDYLMRDIAWGMGISPELLWDVSGAGGANTRYLLEDANVFFAECQAVIREQFCRPFWTFWVWQEIEAGRLENPGDDWWRCDWIAPKPPSVDLGRDGKLYLSLVQAGLMTRKRYHNMMGLDDETEEDDLIQAAKRMKEKCAAAGMHVSEVIAPLPGAAPIESFADDKDDESSDETNQDGQMEDIDIEKIKSLLDSVGVAVRAGIITPSKEVESSLRSQLRLPEMSGDVSAEWDKNPIRSPITLTNQLASPDAQPLTPEPEEEP